MPASEVFKNQQASPSQFLDNQKEERKDQPACRSFIPGVLKRNHTRELDRHQFQEAVSPGYDTRSNSSYNQRLQIQWKFMGGSERVMIDKKDSATNKGTPKSNNNRSSSHRKQPKLQQCSQKKKKKVTFPSDVQMCIVYEVESFKMYYKPTNVVKNTCTCLVF